MIGRLPVRSEANEIIAAGQRDVRRGRNIWFGDGPYKSLADAKLARSTIGVCPKENPAPAGTADKSG